MVQKIHKQCVFASSIKYFKTDFKTFWFKTWGRNKPTWKFMTWFGYKAAWLNDLL